MPARPPGPRNRLLSTYRVLARPLTSMPGWLSRYGDPIQLPTINGDVVMTARPELIKTIFGAHPDGYAPFAARGVASLTGPRSVFQLRADEHRRDRRLMMPPFHGSRMRAYAGMMQQVARRVFGQAADGREVRLHELTQRISLEVILRAVFGVQRPDQVDAFSEAICALVDRISPAFIFMPFLQRELGGLGPYARYRRAWRRFDDMLQERLKRARREAGGEDILSMLVQARDEQGRGMSDQEIRDELRTLLFAGHETTGIALSWAVDLIGRHPAVAARLCDELAALGPDPDPEAVARLPFLEAVTSETLRFYPIVTEVLRQLEAPMELGDYALEPPTAVSASILMVHRRPEIYPEPESFRPERFEERKFSPFEYLPFGGGHRRCIGAAFAGFEMRIVLGTLLQELGVELLQTTPPRPVRRNVTLAPEGGIPVRILRKRAGQVTVAA